MLFRSDRWIGWLRNATEAFLRVRADTLLQGGEVEREGGSGRGRAEEPVKHKTKVCLSVSLLQLLFDVLRERAPRSQNHD